MFYYVEQGFQGHIARVIFNPGYVAALLINF
jgi:hypothetical protein